MIDNDKDNNSDIEEPENKEPKEIVNKINKEEDNIINNKTIIVKKEKKKLKPRIKIFPLLQIRNKSKNQIKNYVKENKENLNSINSKKNLSIQIKQNNYNTFRNKKSLKSNLDSDEPLNLDNNDSSKMTQNSNMNTIYSYSKKSTNNYKNKLANTNGNTESLSEVFDKLLDIKSKIKEIKYKRNKTTKKLIYNSILHNNKDNNNINDNSSSVKKISSNSSGKINFKLSTSSTKYNYTFKHNMLNNKSAFKNHLKSTIFNTHNITPRNLNNTHFRYFRLSHNKTQNLNPKMESEKIKRSNNSFKRIYDHMKYIARIRQNEMVALAHQYKKALEDNEKEKNYHYKNMVFPREMIERIVQIKEELTVNKFRNEYFKRLDLYDTNIMNKFIKNNKKISESKIMI
jgi:hypothetical protein